MFIKFSGIIVASIFITGCGSSLKDFQKMTASERSVKTCNNDHVVEHHRDRERKYSSEINSLETLLMNGYKTVQNCSTTVIDDRNTYLHTGYSIRNTTDVPKDPKKRIIKKCRNQIVPLTGYAVQKYEERKNELLPLLKDARDRKQSSFDSCFKKIRTLSAEEAFGYYKN